MKNIYLLIMSMIALTAGPALAVDKDNDGVDDAIDQCPKTLQVKKVPVTFKYSLAISPERLKSSAQSHPVDKNGCEPDNDRDGVVNSQDYCPNDSPRAISMGVASNGCPKQSDADGTPDYRDNCPGTKSGVKTDRYGCEIKV